MGYSTDDCKKYLITVYKDTEEKGWKRVKKYNDEQQRIARDFQYKDGRVATILETPNGLIDKNLLNKTLSVKPDPKNNPFDKVRNKNSTEKNSSNVKTDAQHFQDFMSKVLSGEPPQPDTTNNKSSIDMLKDFLKEQEERNNQPPINDMFNLGSMPRIYMEAIQDNNGPLNPLVKSKENMVTLLLENVSYESLDTSEEKFLYILVNGTQWEEKEGNQASTDFYNVIKQNESFFDNLVKREIDLPNMYLLHVINTALMIESMDEGYIPFHVMEGQEALKNMCEILEDIVQHYEKRNIPVEFDKEQVEGSVYTLESLKQLCSMNEAEDLWDKQDIDTEIDKLMSLIKSKSPKKGMKP